MRVLPLFFYQRPSSSKNTYFLLPVCLSVRLSVLLSHLFDNVPVIILSWNFQNLLPKTDMIFMQKIKVRDQRPRSQEVMTPSSHFRTVTSVWIHIWQWNDEQSLMLLRRGALLFLQCHLSNFKVMWLKAKKIVDFDPNWAFLNCISR